MKKKSGSELTIAEKELIIRKVVGYLQNQVHTIRQDIERLFAVEMDDKDIKAILQGYANNFTTK